MRVADHGTSSSPDGDGGLPPEGPDPAGHVAVGPVARPWGRGDPAVAVQFEAAGGRADVPDGRAGSDRPGRSGGVEGGLGDERRKFEDWVR